jgi:cell division protein FtsA
LRNLLQLVERRALRQAQHLLQLERGYGDLEPKLVHSAISSVRIDGYPVSNPVGLQGRNLEVNVFNTFAPMAHVGAIETVIRELDLELLAAVAQPYAVARACATEETWEQGAVFVDVGGGTTDVALIRDGGLDGTRMFNLGGRAFTRRLAAALGLSFDEAEVRKIRHSEALLQEDQDERIHALVKPDVEVLLEGLSLCLRELSRGEHLPPTIYLCGGGSLLPELLEELNKGRWASGLPFSRTPGARLLQPTDVQGLSDTTGQLTSPRDVGPLALAYHGLRVEEEDRDLVNSLMRGVLKAIKV